MQSRRWKLPSASFLKKEPSMHWLGIFFDTQKCLPNQNATASSFAAVIMPVLYAPIYSASTEIASWAYGTTKNHQAIVVGQPAYFAQPDLWLSDMKNVFERNKRTGIFFVCSHRCYWCGCVHWTFAAREQQRQGQKVKFFVTFSGRAQVAETMPQPHYCPSPLCQPPRYHSVCDWLKVFLDG